MTFLPILRADVQKYIREHEATPIHTLILKGSPFEDVTVQEIAQQIDSRSRTKEKLPLWYKTEGILYPPKLNLEQSSSEQTALYKSKLIEASTLLDATGGFGVDSYYFSKTTQQVTHVEINEELSAIAHHNFKVLGASAIHQVQQDVIEYLKDSNSFFDAIFIDPARRSDTKQRVFLLEDCTPNVVLHLETLLSSCTFLWIKAAPMLDISLGLKRLDKLCAIYIIAVKNEVKEVLWQLSAAVRVSSATVTTVNLGTEQADQSFSLQDLQDAQATYGEPQQFLYEPNAALLKSGAFQWISSHFSLDKLQEHTHLYTNNRLSNFPGRRFRINKVLPYSKRLKKELSISKAHITTRNFKVTVVALRKKLEIKDGGDVYLFFTTQLEGKAIVLVCSKV